MAFTQSSEPAPTVATFELLDSASPVFISTVGPTTDERLEEAARDDFAVRSVVAASSCFNGLPCSYLKREFTSEWSLSNQSPLLSLGPFQTAGHMNHLRNCSKADTQLQVWSAARDSACLTSPPRDAHTGTALEQRSQRPGTQHLQLCGQNGLTD